MDPTKQFNSLSNYCGWKDYEIGLGLTRWHAECPNCNPEDNESDNESDDSIESIIHPIPNTQYFHNGVQFFPREESMDSIEEDQETETETESKETEIKETKEAETEIEEIEFQFSIYVANDSLVVRVLDYGTWDPIFRWSINKLKQSQLEEQLRKQQAELLELEAQATEADSENVDLPDQEDIKKAYKADLKKKQAVEQSQFLDEVLYETDEKPEIINSCTEDEKEEQEDEPPTKKKNRIIPLQPSTPRKDDELEGSDPKQSRPSIWGKDMWQPKSFIADEDLTAFKDTYEVVSINKSKPVKKFRTQGIEYTVRFKTVTAEMLDRLAAGDPIRFIGNVFQYLFDDLLVEIPPDDYVGVTLSSPEFESDMAQNNREIKLDDTFVIKITHTSISVAGARQIQSVSRMFLEEWLSKKKCVVTIRNKDQLCVARSIVTGIARINKDAQYGFIKQGRLEQERQAVELHRKAGVKLEKCSLKEITCFRAHIPLICKTWKKCLECWKDILIEKSDNHNCGLRKCRACKKMVPDTHRCYIQRYKPSNPVLKPKFCFFDVETMQSKLSDITDNKGREFFQHECGFCEFLFRNFAFKNVTTISHYGQAFDVQFILQYIIEKKETPKIILRGNKIMFLEYSGIRFVDSFNFLPMPLAQLLAAFGITELKKGYFSHFFNTPENQNYVGLFPDSKFFDPDGMKPGPRAAFMKWYDEQKAKQYDFQLEIRTYCTSDVLLLAAATLKFRDLFLQVSDNQIDPLVNTFTFASACNQLFRLRYLNDSELALIPESGLFPARRFNNICCKWLEWEMKLYGAQIKHARNGGEVKVLDNFVDGFLDGSNSASIKDIVYQYHDIRGVEGLVKCKILAFRGLYHPVLPFRHEKKLFFPLCRTCTVEKSLEECHHDDESRSFIGTWTSTEVNMALTKGYMIIKLYKVWHFERGSKDIFKKYISTFLKIKTEASGYPPGCTDPDKFIEDYYQHEGIRLEKEKIGKFAQETVKNQVVFCNHPKDYFDILCNDARRVMSVHFEHDVARVQFVENEDLLADFGLIQNVVVAAQVTAGARLELYRYMDQLQKRLFYTDTDSLIYVSTPTDTYQVPLGQYLGDMTDELSSYGPNSFATSFASCGAKNYSLAIWSPRDQISNTICKVKDIPLTFRTSEIIHMDLMKKLVQNIDKKETVITTNPHKIVNKHHNLYTTRENKVYRLVADKRVLIGDGNWETVPYGY
uniref:DNA-directed DNA polymerase n=1 Tax=Strigamia maritima TaxID=126957 RepID=T1IK08_STRMM